MPSLIITVLQILLGYLNNGIEPLKDEKVGAWGEVITPMTLNILWRIRIICHEPPVPNSHETQKRRCWFQQQNNGLCSHCLLAAQPDPVSTILEPKVGTLAFMEPNQSQSERERKIIGTIFWIKAKSHEIRPWDQVHEEPGKRAYDLFYVPIGAKVSVGVIIIAVYMILIWSNALAELFDSLRHFFVLRMCCM